MAMLSSNPSLKSGFSRTSVGWEAGASPAQYRSAMTLAGSVKKTVLSLLVLVLSASWVFLAAAPSALFAPGIVLALVLNLAISFRPHLARYLTLPYAAIEGIVVGLVSELYISGRIYAGVDGSGLVWAALGLTVSVFVSLLFLYSTRLIKPTANFKLAVAAATGGVFIFYGATLLLGLFSVQMPLVFSTSALGLGFSLLMVALASATLVVDFDYVESGVSRGLPKHMEWYAAFGLMVSLVWLYLEILRLLAKLQSRRN